ncbi:MAG: hypothetical protein [Caudoviricetes sp.]|nr:MAG: hypothetical protein [Caudoviricetes sp.]
MATVKQAQEQPKDKDGESLAGRYRNAINELGVLTKDARGQTGNHEYGYLTLTTVLKAAKEIFAKHDIGFRQSVNFVNIVEGQPFVENRKTSYIPQPMVTVDTIVFDSDSEILVGKYPVVMTGNPKTSGSAITYARRYSLFAALGIYPDDDDDGEMASQYYQRAANPQQQYPQNQQRQQQPPRQQYQQRPQQQNRQQTQQQSYQRPQQQTQQSAPAGGITDQQIQQLLNLAKQGGINLSEVLRQYKGRPVPQMRELTGKDYEAVYKHLIELRHPEATYA